jgi:ankyrin repeat protein
MEQSAPSDMDVYRLLRDEKWDEFATLLDSDSIDPNKKYTVSGIGDMSFYLLPGLINPGTNWLVKKLLEKGAHPDKKSDGDFPLVTACEQKNHEAMELLINAGANVNIGAGLPLMSAAEHCDLWAVERLLQAGADPAKITSTKKKQSAIWFAASYDSRSKAAERLKIITLLVEQGCKLQGNELHRPIHRRDSDLVTLLLSLGCPANEPVVQGEYREFTKGETPLTLATALNTKDIAHLLLKDGSVSKAKVEIVKELLGAGADPNLPNSKGQTPIFLPVAGYEEERAFNKDFGDPILAITKLLLVAGADPRLKPATCKEGSAMDFVENNNLKAFLELFQESKS